MNEEGIKMIWNRIGGEGDPPEKFIESLRSPEGQKMVWNRIGGEGDPSEKFITALGFESQPTQEEVPVSGDTEAPDAAESEEEGGFFNSVGDFIGSFFEEESALDSAVSDRDKALQDASSSKSRVDFLEGGSQFRLLGQQPVPDEDKSRFPKGSNPFSRNTTIEEERDRISILDRETPELQKGVAIAARNEVSQEISRFNDLDELSQKDQILISQGKIRKGIEASVDYLNRTYPGWSDEEFELSQLSKKIESGDNSDREAFNDRMQEFATIQEDDEYKALKLFADQEEFLKDRDADLNPDRLRNRRTAERIQIETDNSASGEGVVGQIVRKAQNLPRVAARVSGAIAVDGLGMMATFTEGTGNVNDAKKLRQLALDIDSEIEIDKAFIPSNEKGEFVESVVRLDDGFTAIVDDGKVQFFRDKEGFRVDGTEDQMMSAKKLSSDPENIETDISPRRAIRTFQDGVTDLGAQVIGMKGFRALSGSVNAGTNIGILYSTMGDNYLDAIKNGKTGIEASRETMLKGAATTIISTKLGGLEKRLTAQGMPREFFKRVEKDIVEKYAKGQISRSAITKEYISMVDRGAKKLLGDGGGEAVEEIVDGIAGDLIDYALNGGDFELPDGKEIANVGFSSFLVGVAGGGVNIAADSKSFKDDLYINSLLHSVENRSEFNRIADELSNQGRGSEVGKAKKIVDYITDEINDYNVTGEDKLQVTGLIAKRQELEEKRDETKNPRAKENAEKQIEKINEEIDGIRQKNNEATDTPEGEESESVEGINESRDSTSDGESSGFGEPDRNVVRNVGETPEGASGSNVREGSVDGSVVPPSEGSTTGIVSDVEQGGSGDSPTTEGDRNDTGAKIEPKQNLEQDSSEAEKSRKLAYDFDGTLTQGDGLSDLGEEVKRKIENGEDVTVVTARENTPENIQEIADKLGIDPSKIEATGDESLKGGVLDRLGIDRNDYFDADQEKQSAIQGNATVSPQKIAEDVANEVEADQAQKKAKTITKREVADSIRDLDPSDLEKELTALQGKEDLSREDFEKSSFKDIPNKDLFDQGEGAIGVLREAVELSKSRRDRAEKDESERLDQVEAISRGATIDDNDFVKNNEKEIREKIETSVNEEFPVDNAEKFKAKKQEIKTTSQSTTDALKSIDKMILSFKERAEGTTNKVFEFFDRNPPNKEGNEDGSDSVTDLKKNLDIMKEFITLMEGKSAFRGKVGKELKGMIEKEFGKNFIQEFKKNLENHQKLFKEAQFTNEDNLAEKGRKIDEENARKRESVKAERLKAIDDAVSTGETTNDQENAEVNTEKSDLGAKSAVKVANKGEVDTKDPEIDDFIDSFFQSGVEPLDRIAANPRIQKIFKKSGVQRKNLLDKIASKTGSDVKDIEKAIERKIKEGISVPIETANYRKDLSTTVSNIIKGVKKGKIGISDFGDVMGHFAIVSRAINSDTDLDKLAEIIAGNTDATMEEAKAHLQKVRELGAAVLTDSQLKRKVSSEENIKKINEVLMESGQTPEQAAATIGIFRKVAESWGAQNGSTPDIFFTEILAGVNFNPINSANRGKLSKTAGGFMIDLYSNSDISTPVHELAHIYERLMSDQDRENLLNWLGKDKMDRDAAEAFAIGFEKWLIDKSNAPEGGVFEKFKKWLQDVYDGMSHYFNGRIPVVTKDMERVYFKMVYGPKRVDNAKNYKDYAEEGRSQWKEIENEGVQLDNETIGDLQSVIEDDLVFFDRTSYNPKQVSDIIRETVEKGYTKIENALAISYEALGNLTDTGLMNLDVYQSLGVSYALVNVRRRLDDINGNLEQNPLDEDLKEEKIRLMNYAVILGDVAKFAGSEAGLTLGVRAKLVRDSQFESAKIRESLNEMTDGKPDLKDIDFVEKESRDVRDLERRVDALQSKSDELTADQIQVVMDNLIKNRGSNKILSKAQKTNRGLSQPEIIRKLNDLSKPIQAVISKFRQFFQSDQEKKEEESFNNQILKAVGLAMLYAEGRSMEVSFTNIANIIKQEVSPNITQDMVFRALSSTDPVVQANKAVKIANAEENLKREVKLLKEVESFVTNSIKERQQKPDVRYSHRVTQLQKLVRNIKRLALADPEVNQYQFIQMHQHLENLSLQFEELMVKDVHTIINPMQQELEAKGMTFKEYTKESIDSAMEKIRQYEISSELKKRENKLADLKSVREQLEKGEFKGDTDQFFPGTSKELLKQKTRVIEEQIRAELTSARLAIASKSKERELRRIANNKSLSDSEREAAKIKADETKIRREKSIKAIVDVISKQDPSVAISMQKMLSAVNKQLGKGNKIAEREFMATMGSKTLDNDIKDEVKIARENFRKQISLTEKLKKIYKGAIDAKKKDKDRDFTEETKAIEDLIKDIRQTARKLNIPQADIDRVQKSIDDLGAGFKKFINSKGTVNAGRAIKNMTEQVERTAIDRAKSRIERLDKMIEKLNDPKTNAAERGSILSVFSKKENDRIQKVTEKFRDETALRVAKLQLANNDDRRLAIIRRVKRIMTRPGNSSIESIAAELKTQIPGITTDEIRQALNIEESPKKARKAVDQALKDARRELSKEAALLSKLEKEISGKFEKKDKSNDGTVSSSDIEALDTIISEIDKANRNSFFVSPGDIDNLEYLVKEIKNHYTHALTRIGSPVKIEDILRNVEKYRIEKGINAAEERLEKANEKLEAFNRGEISHMDILPSMPFRYADSALESAQAELEQKKREVSIVAQKIRTKASSDRLDEIKRVLLETDLNDDEKKRLIDYTLNVRESDDIDSELLRARRALRSKRRALLDFLDDKRKKSWFEKVQSVSAFLRLTVLSLDVSFFGLQAFPVLFRNPRVWVGGTANGLADAAKFVFKKGKKSFDLDKGLINERKLIKQKISDIKSRGSLDTIDRAEIAILREELNVLESGLGPALEKQAKLFNDPLIQEAIEAGLKIQDISGTQLDEEYRLKSFLENPSIWKPVSGFAANFRKMNEILYAGAMNEMRMTLFKDFKKWEDSGNFKDPKKRKEALKKWAEQVNLMTSGATKFGSERTTEFVNKGLEFSTVVLIAPRMYASIFKRIAKLGGIVELNKAREARKAGDADLQKIAWESFKWEASSALMHGAMMAAAPILAGMAFGEDEDDEWGYPEGYLNPWSTNFLRSEIFGYPTFATGTSAYIKQTGKYLVELAAVGGFEGMRFRESLKDRHSGKGNFELTAAYLENKQVPLSQNIKSLVYGYDWRKKRISDRKGAYQFIDRLSHTLAASAPILLQEAFKGDQTIGQWTFNVLSSFTGLLPHYVPDKSDAEVKDLLSISEFSSSSRRYENMPEHVKADKFLTEIYKKEVVSLFEEKVITDKSRQIINSARGVNEDQLKENKNKEIRKIFLEAEKEIARRYGVEVK